MKEQSVILLTGGNSRLGKVMALFLAEKNYVVYATSRKNITSYHTNLHYLPMDVTSDKDVETVFALILKKEKRLDIIINNAGVTLTGKSVLYTADDFKNLLDINLVGPFRVMKAAMAQKTPPNLIINITSLNGFLSLPDFGLYCSSKFALEGLGLALHYELSPRTRVVNVAPGALKAESAKKMPHKPAREKFPILNWLLPLTSLEDVAVVVEQLFHNHTNPPRVLIGRDAKIIFLLQKLLPFRIFDKLIFFISKKK